MDIFLRWSKFIFVQKPRFSNYHNTHIVVNCMDIFLRWSKFIFVQKPRFSNYHNTHIVVKITTFLLTFLALYRTVS